MGVDILFGVEKFVVASRSSAAGAHSSMRLPARLDASYPCLNCSHPTHPSGVAASLGCYGAITISVNFRLSATNCQVVSIMLFKYGWSGTGDLLASQSAELPGSSNTTNQQIPVLYCFLLFIYVFTCTVYVITRPFLSPPDHTTDDTLTITANRDLCSRQLNRFRHDS
jgi:hypothetical protein